MAVILAAGLLFRAASPEDGTAPTPQSAQAASDPRSTKEVTATDPFEALRVARVATFLLVAHVVAQPKEAVAVVQPHAPAAPVRDEDALAREIRDRARAGHPEEGAQPGAPATETGERPYSSASK